MRDVRKEILTPGSHSGLSMQRPSSKYLMAGSSRHWVNCNPMDFATPNTPYYAFKDPFTKVIRNTNMPIICIHIISQTSSFSIVPFATSTNYLILARSPLASPGGQGLTRSGAACFPLWHFAVLPKKARLSQSPTSTSGTRKG